MGKKTDLMTERTEMVLNGAEVRKQRLSKGRTLKELAQAAHISAPYLHYIETGVRTATGSVARAIVKALK